MLRSHRTSRLFCSLLVLCLLLFTVPTHQINAQQPPPPGGDRPGPDFDAAAAQLGIDVETLQNALGPPPHDFQSAAAELGITEEALQAALDMASPDGGANQPPDANMTGDIATNENVTIQTGITPLSHYGEAVATAGDVNGDGFDDVLVGARGDSQSDNSPGAAYVYLGSTDGISTDPVSTMNAEIDGDEFGRSVGFAGDVNGDGFDDVLVGAHAFNNHQGKAYLYLGSATGTITEAAWVTMGEKERDEYGRSVYTAGDVNNDGFDDVLVGASGYSDSMELQGKVYLYMGNSEGLNPNPSWTFTGPNENIEFGRSARTAGDVNGDGFSDVIIGAPGLTRSGDTSTVAGQAMIFYGSENPLENTQPTVISAGNIADRFGEASASAGDINGDGFSDVIVGASGTGNLFIYTGSSSGLNTTPIVLSADSSTDIGRAVGSAGDVNGDGFDDVLAGLPKYNQNIGGFTIYLGGATGVSTEPEVVVTGHGGLGFDVSGLGDINDDGYSDVVGGAPVGGGEQQGEVYIYMGTPE